MFIKPFKTKSNIQIKSTERKRLRSKIEIAFNLSEDDMNKLLPTKGTLNQLKLILHSGQTAIVYTCDRRPMFFEFSPSGDETKLVILPTVYSLWILPDMIPTYTTHAAVLPRLAGGADLMLPGTNTFYKHFANSKILLHALVSFSFYGSGVIKQGTGYSTYGNYARDSVVVNIRSLFG